jgi:hypothetical protein
MSQVDCAQPSPSELLFQRHHPQVGQANCVITVASRSMRSETDTVMGSDINYRFACYVGLR